MNERRFILFIILIVSLYITLVYAIGLFYVMNIGYIEVEAVSIIALLGLPFLYLIMHQKYLMEEGENRVYLRIKIKKIILILIGIIIIIDGILSILVQLDEVYLFQLGRIGRIGLGLFTIFVAFFIDNEMTIEIK